MMVSIDGSIPFEVPAGNEDEAKELAVVEARIRGIDYVSEEHIEVLE